MVAGDSLVYYLALMTDKRKETTVRLTAEVSCAG